MKKWFAPEVVQTSNLDCGPAALTSLLRGFRIHASYSRLREVCQTGLDGTSIDTMETVANQMGLVAEQITVPLDHVFVPEARALPAIAIVQLPTGFTHFVVVWSRIGDYVQVMDPATGRRWMHRQKLTRELYRHKMAVPAGGWREWAGSDDFLNVLKARLRSAGVPQAAIDPRVADALLDGTWRSIAALDAATRLVQRLIDSRAIRRNDGTVRLLDQLRRKPDVIPAQYWTVVPTVPGEDGVEQVMVSGAILVRALQPTVNKNPPQENQPETLRRADSNPLRFGLAVLRQAGWPSLALAVAGVLATAGLTVFEAVFFRSVFDLFSRLRLPEQRAGALLGWGVFSVAALALEWANFGNQLRLARQFEMRLRVAFFLKIPRFGDRYLQSRLTSDMAERAHALFRLRQLPVAVARVFSPVVRLLLTAGGLLWLMPHVWPLLLLIVAAAVLPPLATQPLLRERDLKTRTHAGALTRFYLDAMLGLLPIRAHRAARNLKSEQEHLLGEWAHSALGLQGVAVAAEAIQTVLILAPVVALLLTQSFGSSSAGRLLLTVYWTLNLPLLGREMAAQIRRFPYYRNLLARMVEPLEAAEEPISDRPAFEQPPLIEFQKVSASISGAPILQQIDLTIAPGEHVAIVGPSGAGKSSLVSLLLGWLTPSDGSIHIAGQPLHPEQFRRSVAWVDPSVQIWNDSLFSNIAYGSQETAGDVAAAIERAMLRGVLETLPNGLQTRLGEGGGLVSGGEGQRVRFARATLRADAPVAILDEPFRGLDRDKRTALLARARQIWRNATLFCVTHDIHQTRSFDRVVVVESGRICECGKPADLLADAGSRYAQLLAAERSAYAGLWSAHFWRRIWVADGRAVETVGAAASQVEAEVA